MGESLIMDLGTYCSILARVMLGGSDRANIMTALVLELLGVCAEYR